MFTCPGWFCASIVWAKPGFQLARPWDICAKMFYSLLRNLLFTLPPEEVHTQTMAFMRWAANQPMAASLLLKQFAVPAMPVDVLGLRFRNPVGLAAGFDKNAHYLLPMHLLGFGSVEIGTVTPRPQPGNDLPRLFRLPQDKALLNRMGFNNNGVQAVAGRLEQWHKTLASKGPQRMIVGGNIGKNKDTANDDAWQDYLRCFEVLHPLVDYFVVNVSSPNTPGLRALQEKPALEKILSTLIDKNASMQVQKPILLKIAPDLSDEQIAEIAHLAIQLPLQGLVATNTTIDRSLLKTPATVVENMGAGGISGLPVQTRSTQVVRMLSTHTAGSIPIIASGGIFTGTHALDKLQAGASLVQVYTGFVYEGPGIVGKLLETLMRHPLHKSGTVL